MTDHTPTTKEVHVTVEVDTDELRKWADKHTDAGNPGVAEVLYRAAAGMESITAAHDRKIAAEALRALGQEFHDWAALYAGPDGAHFALVWEKRIRGRADRIEQGGES